VGCMTYLYICLCDRFEVLRDGPPSVGCICPIQGGQPCHITILVNVAFLYYFSPLLVKVVLTTVKALFSSHPQKFLPITSNL
jgi:hypothetical protein